MVYIMNIINNNWIYFINFIKLESARSIQKLKLNDNYNIKYKSKSRLKSKNIKDIHNNNQNNCIEDNNSMNKKLFYHNAVQN